MLPALADTLHATAQEVTSQRQVHHDEKPNQADGNENVSQHFIPGRPDKWAKTYGRKLGLLRLVMALFLSR